MQVDPIKPSLKAPGTKRLRLKHDTPLSNFAFTFNLRRYTEAAGTGGGAKTAMEMAASSGHARLVGRCRMILSNQR